MSSRWLFPLFFSVFVSVDANAVDGLVTTAPDPATTQPQTYTGNHLEQTKGKADLVHSFASILTDFVNKYRLDRQTEEALRAQMQDVAKNLHESGAAGMLLEGRFAVDKGALLCGDDCGPVNMTQHLIGGQLHVVGQGRSAGDVAALSLDEERNKAVLKPGVSRNEQELFQEKKVYWATLGKDGKPGFRELDAKDLYAEAYLTTSDKQRVERLRRQSYQWALDDMARSLVLNAGSKELKASAEELLQARDRAQRDMEASNERLREALGAANRSNADADRIAILAGLAGAASSIVSNYDSQPKDKQPSSATLNLLKERVEIENNFKSNETIIRSSAESRKYKLWLDSPR